MVQALESSYSRWGALCVKDVVALKMWHAGLSQCNNVAGDL